MFRGVGEELRPMLRLAGPVVIAELGWMSMGIVDTIMVGRLGPEAIGAVGVGSNLFMALGIFGMGLLLGLDTLVSQSFGAGRLDDCHRWLVHGIYLSLLLTVPMMAAAWAGIALLPAFGLHPDVLVLTSPYLGIIAWSILPLLLYASFRRYLQAMGLVRPVTFALVTANVINAGANWVLVFGNLGAPALGTDGAGWATLISRVYLAMVLFLAILAHDRRYRSGTFSVSWKLATARLTRLVRLGFPAATQVTLEVGVFAAATALAARLDPIALASHQIALNIASMTFMVPLGVASAGAVRVGHAVGRRDPQGAGVSGWTAILLGASFMSLAALSFVLFPRLLIRVFTTDAAVIATGVSLLLIAAVFQLFDGLQGVATGVLRGLGDTKTPMLANLTAHWLLGLPLGYLLAFGLGWGVEGLWIGLSCGLIIIGTVLIRVWSRRVSRLSDQLDLRTAGSPDRLQSAPMKRQ
jgi:multidrug resistance protein, MATE family